MCYIKTRHIILVICFTIVGLTKGLANDDTNVVATHNKIYEEGTDGGKLIASALGVAEREQKCVLIMFGANSCVPCLSLHKLMESDREVSSFLKDNYVVVMVDVSLKSTNSCLWQYNNGIVVFPLLAVLDSGGKHLTTQNAVVFMKGEQHSPQLVLGFLQDWALKPEK
jgi:thioredoxin-related protein